MISATKIDQKMRVVESTAPIIYARAVTERRNLDAWVALTKKDQRIFLPGSHRTRVHAVRALLADGWAAEWEERGDSIRPRMGWVWVVDSAGEKRHLLGNDLLPALAPKDAREAWAVLQRAPEIDPEYLGALDAAPETIPGAIALAAAPSIMREAEQLVREAFSRAAPFGAGECPPITWRSSTSRGLRGLAYDRSALSVHGAVIDKLGYGTWMSSSHPAQDMFSFTRWGVDIPETLTAAWRDMGQAMQFQLGRANRVVTPSGLAYADVENPFEPLLEVAYSGIVVEKVTPERVVLVVVEE